MNWGAYEDWKQATIWLKHFQMEHTTHLNSLPFTYGSHCSEGQAVSTMYKSVSTLISIGTRHHMRCVIHTCIRSWVFVTVSWSYNVSSVFLNPTIRTSVFSRIHQLHGKRYIKSFVSVIHTQGPDKGAGQEDNAAGQNFSWGWHFWWKEGIANGLSWSLPPPGGGSGAGGAALFDSSRGGTSSKVLLRNEEVVFLWS